MQRRLKCTGPEYTDWQNVLHLLQRSIEGGQEGSLFQILLTADERNALIARVNIINELLKGDLSQRELSQMLGVGIATITRGSNELKQLDEDKKEILIQLLKQPVN